MKKINEYDASEININALYVGEHWDVYSDKFKINNSISAICARGVMPTHNVDDAFTPLEIESAHFMLLMGDLDSDKSLGALLSFTKKFKSLNKEGVLLAVMPKSLSSDSCLKLKKSVDHIVFVANDDMLSAPLKMINNALNATFIDIDFFDLYDALKKFKASVLSSANCKNSDDLNAFVESIKNDCGATKLSVDGMLIYLSVDGKIGSLDLLERIISAFEPIAEGRSGEIIIAAQFAEQDCLLEATILTMTKN
jgi:hypothetical protein